MVTSQKRLHAKTVCRRNGPLQLKRPPTKRTQSESPSPFADGISFFDDSAIRYVHDVSEVRMNCDVKTYSAAGPF